MNRLFVTVLVALAVCAVGSVRAGDDEGWRVRVDFAIVEPDGNTGVVDFDTGAGFGIRGEYQFSRRLGIDFGFLSTANVDVSVGGGGSSLVDISSFSPFTVGLDVHLTPDGRVDLYAGPQLAWVSYGNVRVGSGGSVSIDSDLGLGAILGLDVPLGERRRWAFQTNVRYFGTSMEPIDVDFDPTIFSLGFGYRG